MAKYYIRTAMGTLLASRVTLKAWKILSVLTKNY